MTTPQPTSHEPKGGDLFIVALARSVKASVIVTGDRHLPDITDLQPPAVTPRQFLDAIERHGV